MKAYRVFANLLFTNVGPPMTGVAIDFDQEGRVLEIQQDSTPAEYDIRTEVLAPGFVNAHCHLELSNLKGQVEEDARGMAYFIGKMLELRRSLHPLPDDISLQEADLSMQMEGVVAVGDISNSTASLPVKAKSSIRYHTFIEVMGHSGDRAIPIWDAGNEMREEFTRALGPGSASITPHALYSVSRELMNTICSRHPYNQPLSIHMQESIDELEYCRDKSGALAALFSKMNVPDSGFIPYGNESPLLKMLTEIPSAVRVQTVHNTFTSRDEIRKALELDRSLFWCLCPSANLYITGRLPDVSFLMESGATITVGTDSLASNDRLSMVKELSILQEYHPRLQTDVLLRWASLHGAQFLGLENEIGTVEPGKKPGLVVLENMDPNHPRFRKGVKASKLVVNG